MLTIHKEKKKGRNLEETMIYRRKFKQAILNITGLRLNRDLFQNGHHENYSFCCTVSITTFYVSLWPKNVHVVALPMNLGNCGILGG